MNLYYVEFADNEGDVVSSDIEVAESIEHCIAGIKKDEWRCKSKHIHSIEHIYKFQDYKDCLRRLEICINYAFAQVEQLSIVGGQFADSTINCDPVHAEMDQGHACSLSCTADLVDDRLKAVKKYIQALEYMTTKQRCWNQDKQTEGTEVPY